MRVHLIGFLIISTAVAGCLGSSPSDDLEPVGSGEEGNGSDPGDPGTTGSSQGGEDGDGNGGETEPAPDGDTPPAKDPQDEDSDGNGPPGNTPPTAFLSVSDEEFFVPYTVTFELDGWDPDGDAVRWTLRFGDGNHIRGSQLPTTVSHTYQEAGVYTATLIVSDGKSLSADMVQLDGANVPEPQTYEGTVLLPDRLDDLFDNSCMSEELARFLIDTANQDGIAQYNEVVNTLNEAILDAHAMLLETAAMIRSAYEDATQEPDELNETILFFNDILYNQTGFTIPYQYPDFPEFPDLEQSIQAINDLLLDLDQMAQAAYRDIENGLRSLEELIEEVNEDLFNETGQTIPYSHPDFPDLPNLPADLYGLDHLGELDYLEGRGVTWNHHVVPPQLTGWPYQIDSAGVMAEFRSANWSLIDRSTSSGSVPNGTTFIVVCMTPVVLNENEDTPLIRDYELVMTPPDWLLERPGPDEGSGEA